MWDVVATRIKRVLLEMSDNCDEEYRAVKVTAKERCLKW